MAISTACYATREEVKAALDIKLTTRSDAQVDRAIESASRSIEGLLHRRFYSVIQTAFFDWPNFQYAYPWRIWFDERELADVTTNVPVVTSGGNVITAANIFWGPWNYSPPFTFMELDRSSSASFGQGSTPQRDVQITGTFGYQDTFTTAGALAVGCGAGDATITVTNGAVIGVGDVIMIGSERILATDKTMVDTTQAQQGSGVSTASAADVTLAVTDGTKFSSGEIVLLDSERMLIVDVAGNNLTVKRAWDGSVLAAHSGAEIYALRVVTVTRGSFGSTAASHSGAAAITRALIPPLVKELAVGEALNSVLQEQGGYARTQGQGAGAQTNVGMSLDAIRKQALARYGRKARSRVV
jgi:hypothetical protein